MPTTRALLARLSRDELLGVLDAYELAVPDRRIKDRIVEVLAASDHVRLDDLLLTWPRVRLKALCRGFDLDESGREKALLVERLTSSAPVPQRAEVAGHPPPVGRRGRGGAETSAGARNVTETQERTGSLGFESKLWEAADLLRNNMDPAEYKHVVLGLLFLKYIEDAFDERREELRLAVADPDSDYHVDEGAREAELETLLEDRDEYTAENVFWVPAPARWSHIQAQAKQPTIGKTIDDAMDAIERENPALKGVLPKVFALPNLDKYSLGKLIDIFSSIGLGTKEQQDKDTLGRIYEYFLSRFASAEGKGGGEFYTPTSVVRLLVAMLEPYKGRVFDPCCGSGGMFVQSLKFIDAHNGRRDQITVYGQESNRTTWRMAQMNLAIRGI